MLALVPAVLLPLGRGTARSAARLPSPIERAYANLGRWIDANTPASATIGYMEIGIVGFYAKRTLIDALGLVNPGVAEHVAQRDVWWAFRHHRPDYIIILMDVPEEPWFKAEYRFVAELDSARHVPLRVYRREPKS
jgi:hypothetical protein